MIEQSLRKEWQTHPVTADLVRELTESLEDLKERWVQGNLTDPSAEGTVQLNSRSIGEAQAYKNMLEQIAQIAEA